MPPDANPETGPHADAAAWALSALDHDDAIAFRQHLLECEQCQATVAEFQTAAQGMAHPAPAVEPPADLGVRTLAAVQQAAMADKRSAETVPRLALPAKPSAGARTKASRWWHRRWSVSPLGAAAALGATVGIVLAVAAVALPRHTEPASPSLHSPASAPAQVAETAAIIPLRGADSTTASGRAVIYRVSGGWLIKLTVHGLPALGPRMVYNCWYTRPGNTQWVPAGSFVMKHSGSETFSMTSAADPQRFTTMKIIAEHLGNPRPLRGQVVLSGTAIPG
jgi:hypothetical protein